MSDTPRPAPGLEPVTLGERISSVDVIRGVALLGILLMNITSFGLPEAAYSNPSVSGGASGWNLNYWFVNQVLFEGKMRAIFSMLFGAGVIIFTSRMEQRNAGVATADLYYRRTLWLVAFGLVHAYFIWVGDILFFYGVAGLFLFPFRKLAPRVLVTAGLILLALNAPKFVMEDLSVRDMKRKAEEADRAAASGKKLTGEQTQAKKAWDEKLAELKPDAEKIKKEIADHRGSYGTLFLHRAGHVARWQSSMFYTWGFFDVCGMMLLGMGLFKMGFFSAIRSFAFYTAMLVLGYGIGMAVNTFVGLRVAESQFDPLVMNRYFVPYDLGRMAVALGHIALVMIVCKAGVLSWITSPLASVGQMALTGYLTTSLICTTIFYGYGFKLFGQLERYQLLYVLAGVWLFLLIACPIWLRYFRYGPAEWAWRSLTYGKRQPMRIGMLPPPERPESALAGAA